MTVGEVCDAAGLQSGALRDTLLRTAYEGEITGEAMYACLEQWASTDRQRHATRLLAVLERETGEMLLPVMIRHNVMFDREAALQRGEDFTMRSVSQGWVAYFEKVIPLVEAALVDMKRLHELSDEADRFATGLLVAHEEAFLEFVHREVVGAPDSVVPLEMVSGRPTADDPSFVIKSTGSRQIAPRAPNASARIREPKQPGPRKRRNQT